MTGPDGRTCCSDPEVIRRLRGRRSRTEVARRGHTIDDVNAAHHHDDAGTPDNDNDSGPSHHHDRCPHDDDGLDAPGDGAGNTPHYVSHQCLRSIFRLLVERALYHLGRQRHVGR